MFILLMQFKERYLVIGTIIISASFAFMLFGGSLATAEKLNSDILSMRDKSIIWGIISPSLVSATTVELKDGRQHPHIERLQAQNTVLINTIDSQKSHYTKRIDSFKLQVAELEQQLQQSSSSSDSNREKELEDEIEELNNKIRDLENGNSGQSNSNNDGSSDSDNRQLKNEIKRLEAQLKTKAINDKNDDGVSVLETQVKQLKEDLKKEKAKKVKRDRSEIEERIYGDLQKALADITKLKNEIKELKDENKKLKKSLKG